MVSVYTCIDNIVTFVDNFFTNFSDVSDFSEQASLISNAAPGTGLYSAVTTSREGTICIDLVRVMK